MPRSWILSPESSQLLESRDVIHFLMHKNDNEKKKLINIYLNIYNVVWSW